MPNSQGTCPICDAQITVAANTEESEILTCQDCNNQVVVESISGNQAVLSEAPEIEEDWGE
jgi:alpha-aminoadipate/glutamate carrier protein LysW